LYQADARQGRLVSLSTIMSPHVQLIILDTRSRAAVEKKFNELVSVHPHCRSLMGQLFEQQFEQWMPCIPLILV
jgi:hypothetical protein